MTTHIPFKNTGFFSKTMIDYLDQSSSIQEYYGNFPNIDGFRKQIELKKKTKLNRSLLVQELNNQYSTIEISKFTADNISLLAKENTFTITTGHQLNLFTGPLYFLYKIISTINLCEQLAKEFPENNFVPMYWMATEDHDFEEINFFNFKDKKFRWNSNQSGAVGRFSTEGLDKVLDIFSTQLNSSKASHELRELFQKGYCEHSNLADATRYIVDSLFKDLGLVIIDGDNKNLKNEFVPYVKRELFEQIAYKKVSETVDTFSKEYKVQVNPREINLFYIKEDIRERIIFKNSNFYINNTDLKFSKDEILNELTSYPECFSPNVILRPLYQEVILPNLAYIGGGGEIAYWLELKSFFEEIGVVFPIVMLRNSVQIISKKQHKKLDKLGVSLEDIFKKQQDLVNEKILEDSDLNFDFSQQKEFLKQQFDALREIAKKTDSSFVGAINAQEKKQTKGLYNLEKRLLRAEKRNKKELVNSIVQLQNDILPNQSLEERQRNFSEYIEEYGFELIKQLKDNLNPLVMEFIIFTI